MAVDRHHPPYRVAGAVFLIVIAAAATLTYKQFRGDFEQRSPLIVVAPRATSARFPPTSRLTSPPARCPATST
jgi:hypothetical protein